MKLHAITDESQGYLRNELYWELEESDYGTLPVSEECLAIVRATQDGLFLGRPRRVNKTFNEDSQVPVYYIADSVWPNKQAPKSSFKNGVTGAESEADAPDPEYRVWHENFDTIKSWRGKLSKTVTSMCRMYWDPNFPHMNRNACYELRNGGLALVGGAAEEKPAATVVNSECKQEETNAGPVDIDMPETWHWDYSSVDFPETMQQVDALINPMTGRGKYKYGYDFGKFAISQASSSPSLDRSIRAVKCYHYYAIARALILKSRDISFPWQYVYKSTLESMRSNSRMGRYRDKIVDVSEHGSEREKRALDKISTDIVTAYQKYMDGPIHHTGGKFAEVAGQKWNIKYFIIELRENLRVSLKKFKKAGQK